MPSKTKQLARISPNPPRTQKPTEPIPNTQLTPIRFNCFGNVGLFWTPDPLFRQNEFSAVASDFANGFVNHQTQWEQQGSTQTPSRARGHQSREKRRNSFPRNNLLRWFWMIPEEFVILRP